jgi:hypothetical protein
MTSPRLNAFKYQYAVAIVLKAAPAQGIKKIIKDAKVSGVEDDMFTIVGKGSKAMQ